MTEETERESGRLTYSERACLQSVARGLSPDTANSASGQCGVTSDEHLASARRKLMASTTVEAVARALKMGLIE